MNKNAASFFGQFSFILFLFIIHFGGREASADYELVEKSDIARVWAGHPVDFAITEAGDFLYVAFYDTTRQMAVARRKKDSANWTFKSLPATTGWDSHNYIDMAADDSGYIHISGNMHNVPLIYYRSSIPFEIGDFTSPGMIGNLENSVTYPVFVKRSDGKLFFQYRDGGSGNGTTIWNSYDVITKKWLRITSSGLFNGEGQVNAYQTSPVAGPDGFFHVIWMWRNTPVANTNHHLSHIKSRDLINWETMSGVKLQIPITQSTQGVVADPVGPGRGLINMDFGIGWDSQNRPILTYHRYDNASVSQIFNTRWENGSWKIYTTSNWTSFKWNLDLTGSLTHDIAAQPVTVEDGKLIQDYVYRDNVKRRWILDENTLKPLEDKIFEHPEAMKEMYVVESTFPGMQANIKRLGDYYIKWETLPINQDMPRSSYPSSSVLRLYHFSHSTPVVSPVNTRQRTISFEMYQGMIRLSVATPENYNEKRQLRIFNPMGKEVLEKSIYANQVQTIPTSGWAKGIYIARIAETRDKKSDVIRFVLQ